MNIPKVLLQMSVQCFIYYYNFNDYLNFETKNFLEVLRTLRK